MTAAVLDTVVAINDETGEIDRLTLAELLASNEDGFDHEEAAAIVAAIGAGEAYVVGGGAAVAFIISRVEE
jgi:hypothetical protein